MTVIKCKVINCIFSVCLLLFFPIIRIQCVQAIIYRGVYYDNKEWYRNPLFMQYYLYIMKIKTYITYSRSPSITVINRVTIFIFHKISEFCTCHFSISR